MSEDSSAPEIEEAVSAILAAAAPYQFRTFVVGFRRKDDYRRESHEARFRKLKIAVGDRLLAIWPGRDVEFERPDVRFNVGLDLSIEVEPSPLYIAGRYRKLSRGIPATRWIHHRCHGRGCPDCNHTGNLCGPSLQEILEGPVLAATGGLATLFHGLGREDTDARMLGRGRPFVLEVHRPVRRTIDLPALAPAIAAAAGGLAEFGPLAHVHRAIMQAVKSSTAEKTYRARIEIGAPLPEGAADRAARLAGITVRQLSPTRVAERRGPETVRPKRVVESRWLGPFEGGQLWECRVESGTYVKELVSGDGGRTRPSLAELLGIPLKVAALDVLEVHWDPPWE
jgi:tRNA pseudouridine synthase 10